MTQTASSACDNGGLQKKAFVRDRMRKRCILLNNDNMGRKNMGLVKNLNMDFIYAFS